MVPWSGGDADPAASDRLRCVHAGRLAALTAIAVLALAGCGEDNDESGSTGTGTTGTGTQEQPAPTGPASETVELRETEFAIEPAEALVEKAGVVEFRVKNDGGVTHALEVESEELEEETEDIAAGESATLKVELEEGTYELYCPIGDHKDRGMEAELVVGSTSAGEGEDDSSSDDSPSGY